MSRAPEVHAAPGSRLTLVAGMWRAWIRRISEGMPTSSSLPGQTREWSVSVRRERQEHNVAAAISC